MLFSYTLELKRGKLALAVNTTNSRTVLSTADKNGNASIFETKTDMYHRKSNDNSVVFDPGLFDHCVPRIS